ncbi:MAG TPA: maleylpyruvate isomerase family mycothiol-dependent enzyme [Acidimicrobiales bacterium]|nr:maleylpyruvate isomerase family mycothiol-dependent enzyme [Acidimicrobiales bacterium]
MTDAPPEIVASEYAAVRRRVRALVEDLPPDDLGRAVPACPKWTVRDVVAHLAGGAADAASGNLTGAGGEEWTAAQVEARRDRPVAEILDEWDQVAEGFEPRLPDMGMLGTIFLADAISHELDIRGALGSREMRDAPAVDVTAAWFAGMLSERAAKAGLRPLTVRVADRAHDAGDGLTDGVVVEAPSAFDLLRAATGRRSLDQIREWARGDDLSEHAEVVSVFPPRPDPLVE